MKLITPTWAVPAHIHAFTTTRLGGVSSAPFDSLNLGLHVGDHSELVLENRKLLQQFARLPQVPLYLNQTHSTRVLCLPYSERSSIEADAVYSNEVDQVCLVMTADCLPVLFCSQDGSEIAAAHAGWRGLCDGILEATVAEFVCSPADIRVWLGPAIGKMAFQVGQEVVDQFCTIDADALSAFTPDPSEDGKFFGDLYQLARQRLNKLDIYTISGGDYCTFSDATQFFSYRRDKTTGRMATFIWKSKPR